MSLPFDIKALSQRYDVDGQPVYLSLYADLTDPRHADALRKRHREIRAAMTTQESRRKVDAAVALGMEALETAKARAGAKAVAAFIGPHGFIEIHALQAHVPTRLVLDASPYVAPLARFADDNESFALILLDSEHAAIFVVWAGKAELRKELETRTAKRDFVPRLPKAMQANVAVVLDVDFKEGPADDALVRRFTSLMRDEEAKQSAKWAEALRRELVVGELAMTGALECARMAAAGRVERLLVLGGASFAGAKCEQHQAVFARGESCHCGSKGADVDLVNEAVEFTSRADGQCEFVNAPDAFLAEAGGVGALLRW